MTTETKKEAPPKIVGPVKMRAVQDLFGIDFDQPQTYISEGQVFRYKGPVLSEELAVKVDENTPLGMPVEAPRHPNDPTQKEPPPTWSTAGFVGKATEERGAGGAA